MKINIIYKYICIFCLSILYLCIFKNIVCAASIIIDPGHSPNKSGALSCTGDKEYNYNDELVKNIKNELDRNNIDSKLTRNPNQDMSLIARTRDTKNAQLFISVHHDSVQPQFIKYLNGNPTSNKDEGYSIFVSRKNKYFDKSVEYAKELARNLYDLGLRPSKHHGEKIKGENREALDDKLGIYFFDDLVVLKNSQCPAVLFEAGVIVNPKDEQRVKTDEFKSNVSQSILKSINNVLK